MSLNDFFLNERNLGKVIRWSNQVRIKDESVAEHVFHTALYAMILSDMERSFGNKVDTERVLRCCLLHDLEESLTGDIIHSFKYSDPELLKNMRKMGEKFFERIVGGLPGKLPEEYADLWKGAKEENIEGKIVEAADKIEALLYSIEEYSLGNKSFRSRIDYVLGVLDKIELRSVKVVLEGIDIPK